MRSSVYSVIIRTCCSIRVSLVV